MGVGQGKGGGRKPRVLTGAEMAQVEGLASVLTQDQMADYFGMSRPTFAAIMVRQPEVALLYQKGKAKAIGVVAQGLLTEARNGNMTAAIFYLKTQAGWKETTVTEGPGPNGEHRVETISAVDKLKGYLNGIAKRSGETGEPAPE